MELKSKLDLPDGEVVVHQRRRRGRLSRRRWRPGRCAGHALEGLGYGADEIHAVLVGSPRRGRDGRAAEGRPAAPPASGCLIGNGVWPREELLSPDRSPTTRSLLLDEPGLRPKTLAEFVGQSELKGHLSRDARRRGQAAAKPPTICCSPGPPGLGKTTLANIIAAEMGTNLQVTSGPALERAGDLASILSKLEDGDVLFIDEIHRLPRPVEEVLYPAMEDFRIDVVLGKGPGRPFDPARSGPLHPRGRDHPHRSHHRPASGPLRTRRPPRLLRGRRSPVDRHAGRRHPRGRHRPRAAPTRSPAVRAALPASPTDCCARCGTTPRSNATATSTAEVAADGLAFFGVDELGLDKASRAVLDSVCRRFGGGPVGLSTLAISVSEPTETVEDVYEPYLIQQGLLMRTPRGRVATPGRLRPSGHDATTARPRQAGPEPQPGLFDSGE